MRPVPVKRRRTYRPAAGPTQPIHLPKIRKERLANGLNVWLVERHELPLIAVHFLVHAGADHDRSELPGLATMTAEALDAGTATMDMMTIAERIEFLGAAFSSRATIDGTFVSLVTLTKHLEEALDVVAGILTDPSFPRQEFDRRTRQRRASLLQQNDLPAAIATRAFSRSVYTLRHPYGNDPSGTEKSLLGMSREDAALFCSSYYRPNNTTVVVVGDVAPDTLMRTLNRKLESWPFADVPLRVVPPPPDARARRLYLIHKARAPQSEIRIGCPALTRTSPDAFAVSVMNRILGGQFSSRLNANLRERRGLTYGAHSGFLMYRGRGPFVASAAVLSEKTAVALREFLFEIDRMHGEGILPAELEFSRKGLTGSLPLTLETPAQVATSLQMLALYGLPDDYFATYARNVEAVTLADVRRVSERYLDTSTMAVVIVGDVPEIRRGLEQLNIGEVVLCDLNGDVLAGTGS